MKTYQDLLDVGLDEQKRMDFVLACINEHKTSKRYRLACDAALYYNGENPTINRYEKLLYDFQGRAHVDLFSANHKIASKFFGFVVDQEVSYLLGNGVTFGNDRTKESLGADFDLRTMDIARYALISGVAFGFFNLDHLQIFKLTEFVPLYDEEDGALKAGVRFWQVSDNKPLRATLYEMDGYTDYYRPSGENMQIRTPKRAYKQIVMVSAMDGEQIFDGENYPGFPIVPLKNGENALSELVGRRNTIDALDLCTSNMVNNVDEGNLIYWVLTNCNGMDDLDDAQFIERLKTTHVAHADGVGESVNVEPHTIEAPYAGTQSAIDTLTKKLYTDFQAFDASAVSAGNQTATAIKASYVPLDLKTDKFESYVTEWILEILKLAGINDTPTYNRNQIINKSEETQTVLMGATYYDDEYITKKLLTILGDADQYDEMMRRRDAEDMARIRTAEVTDDAGQSAPDDGRGTAEAGEKNSENL